MNYRQNLVWTEQMGRRFVAMEGDYGQDQDEVGRTLVYQFHQKFQKTPSNDEDFGSLGRYLPPDQGRDDSPVGNLTDAAVAEMPAALGLSIGPEVAPVDAVCWL